MIQVYIVGIYVKLIQEKKKTIDEVPLPIREEVRRIVEGTD